MGWGERAGEGKIGREVMIWDVHGEGKITREAWVAVL
jgi:hypothetical protein